PCCQRPHCPQSIITVGSAPPIKVSVTPGVRSLAIPMLQQSGVVHASNCALVNVLQRGTHPAGSGSSPDTVPQLPVVVPEARRIVPASRPVIMSPHVVPAPQETREQQPVSSQSLAPSQSLSVKSVHAERLDSALGVQTGPPSGC